METASDPGAYLGDSLAWSQPGDRTTSTLVVTSAELLAKVDRPYLSASTAKAMHSCPARMVSDRATPSGFDLFSATEKGSAAHTVLERLYQLPPGRRDKQHAMAILTEMSRETPRSDDDVDYAKAIGADPVRYNQWIAEVDASMRGIWAIEDPITVEVHATELRLDGIEVGGVPFKGFIDRIDVLEDGGLGVVDYKTGKDKSKVNKHFDDDHGDQIRLYIEALRASTGVKPRGGALLYITHGKKRRVAISDAEVRKTVRGFAQSWTDLRKAVDTQHFATSVSALCGWCPLVDSCPAAIEAGKVDRKGGAPSAAELGIGTLRPDGTLIPFRRPRPDAAELPAAAHLSVEGEPPEELEQGAHAMSGNDRPWKEAKPYEGDSVDGHLSLNSYAATAVFGLASLAAEQLSTGGQKVGPAPVKALTALLATVVLEAQEVVTNGTRDFQFGANTRIRGVLRTSLDVIPLPFGGDTEAWTKWAGRTHNFIVAVAGTAIDLFDNGPALDLDFLVQTIVPAATMPVAVPAAA